MPGDNEKPATPKDGRLAGLDAVRFAAAMMVVATHFAGRADIPTPGNWGGNGVSVFFVLSGYLLWRPFVAGYPSVRHYAIARAARILPAYWLACLVLTQLRGGSFLAFALFSPNQYPVPIGVLWTLQAEVAFYFALPFLGLLRRPLAVPVILGAVSLGIELALANTPYHGGYVESWLPVRFWAFAPGMILAALPPKSDRRWLWLALGFLGFASLTLADNPGGGQWTSIPAVVGSFFLVGWGITANPRFGGYLSAGAAISFSLYLWHVDLIETVGMAGLPLTFLVASASYVLLEAPVLRWSKGEYRGVLRRKLVPARVRGVEREQQAGRVVVGPRPGEG